MEMSRIKRGFAVNRASCTMTVAVLCVAIVFGFLEFLLWGRTHLEDGIPLLILLLLASFHLLTTPIHSLPSNGGRIVGWVVLLLAALLMGLGSLLSRGLPVSQQNLFPPLCKNGAVFLVALAFVLRHNGFSATTKMLPLLLLAIVVLPLYELLLLEFSYPLRLVSTAISVFFLRICGFHVSYDGTSLFWENQTLSITDACSGIALLSLFFLIEYLLVHSEKTETWKKWGWASLILLWVTLGNAFRLLLTFLLYRSIGEEVYQPRPHFLLGCFFVVVTTLFIWFSSYLFKLDQPPSEKP